MSFKLELLNDKVPVGEITITGNRIIDPDGTIKSAWVIQKDGTLSWVSDIPLYLRGRKIKKIMSKI